MRQYLKLIALSSFWGSSFLAIKSAIAEVPPIFAATLRMTVALTFFIVVLAVRRRARTIPGRLLPRVWLTGLFSIGIPFSLLFLGIRDASVCFTGIMDGSVPLWTFLWLVVFARQLEPITPTRFLGLLLGLGGILVIFFPHLNHLGGGLRGKLLLVLMANAYAIGVLLNRLLFVGAKQIDLLENVAHQTAASLLYLLCVSFIFEDWSLIQPMRWGLGAYAAILYLGLCCTALAWIFFYSLIREWGALRASVVCYLTPPMAMLFDFLVTGTPASPFELAGTATILIGVALVESQNAASQRRRAGVRACSAANTAAR
ncbi:MAG: DMT family transporter [Bdellovibrionales bacterium]|nr:DMT family transporter [Bdellovibrionales bacterium]